MDGIFKSCWKLGKFLKVRVILNPSLDGMKNLALNKTLLNLIDGESRNLETMEDLVTDYFVKDVVHGEFTEELGFIELVF